jgi:hypothetical protein
MVAADRITSFFDELARRFRPQRVVLFGSYASDRPALRRKSRVIATLVCGLAFLSGCRAPATSAPADEPESIHTDAAPVGDAAVLQVVFDDMSNKDNSESPVEWRGDPSKPVYVSKNPCARRRLDAAEILSRNEDKKWKTLTAAQQQAATEAADDLIARADKGHLLPELKSASGRVKVYEDAGAATQPTRKNPFRRERPSCVFPPGYSKDGRYAVVFLGFPWSGEMHSGDVTYVLERTDRGWKVLLRDFTYYL